MRIADPPGPSSVLKLMTFLSPAFPVGAFAYSHGLEWAIEAGPVSDGESLRSWLVDVLEVGAGWNDAVLFVHAYRAARTGDDAGLLELADLAAALAGSRERHIEAMEQGRALSAAVSAAWPCEPVDVLRRAGGAALPVSVAATTAGHAIPLDHALPAYLNSVCASLISVAVRLVPLGQTEGLEVLAALHPAIAAVSERAAGSTLADLGSCAVLSDIASMRHEHLHSRVFRT